MAYDFKSQTLMSGSHRPGAVSFDYKRDYDPPIDPNPPKRARTEPQDSTTTGNQFPTIIRHTPTLTSMHSRLHGKQKIYTPGLHRHRHHGLAGRGLCISHGRLSINKHLEPSHISTKMLLHVL
jgi:hypothetical protein